MPMELILNLKKKYVSSSCVFDFLKKSVLKLFGPHCVYSMTQERVSPYSKITIN